MIPSSSDFGHWFAGFAAGEGCFHIKRIGGPTGSYICMFIIGLREDDRPILEEIRAWTGLGDIYITRPLGSVQVRWEVARKADCVALVDVFDRFPLRAKKARDYAIWRTAVQRWQLVTARRRADWTEIERLKVSLERGRRLPVAA